MKIKAFLFASVFLASACSAGLSSDSGDSNPTFIYHPAGIMLPFPSDRYLMKDDGSADETAEKASGYRLSISGYEHSDPALVRFPGIGEGLTGMDGFGTSSDIAIGLTASPELGDLSNEDVAFQRSIEDSSPIKLISIDPNDKNAGKSLPFVARFDTDGMTLFLSPWKPLKPLGWYAVVMTRDLRDVTGRPYQSPGAFVSDYAKNTGAGLEGEGFARLKEVAGEPPVFALTFRTASIRPKLEKLIDSVRDLSPTPPTYTVTASPAGHADLSAIVEGWFLHRNYRDANGKLHDQPVGDEWIRFTVTIPKTTGTLTEPFHVVLGQHGLGDKRQAVLNLADGFAREGLATVAIDAPNHGSRGPGEGKSYPSLDGAREALGVWTDGNDITFRSWQFRDIVRQQVLDHLQVIQLLQTFAIDVTRPGNVAGPDLDASDIVYTGQSMGGIMGGISGGELQELKRVVLNVPGARLSNILVRNEILGSALIAILRPKTITTSDAYRMVAMAQGTIDPGDPANYVDLINAAPKAGLAARPLLMQAALGDKTIPNIAVFDMARVAGAPFIGPWEAVIPDLRPASIPSAGLAGEAPVAFALYHDIEVNGKPAIAEHGNLWASDTALSRAAKFLRTGVIPQP